MTFPFYLTVRSVLRILVSLCSLQSSWAETSSPRARMLGCGLLKVFILTEGLPSPSEGFVALLSLTLWFSSMWEYSKKILTRFGCYNLIICSFWNCEKSISCVYQLLTLKYFVIAAPNGLRHVGYIYQDKNLK